MSISNYNLISENSDSNVVPEYIIEYKKQTAHVLYQVICLLFFILPYSSLHAQHIRICGETNNCNDKFVFFSYSNEKNAINDSVPLHTGKFEIDFEGSANNKIRLSFDRKSYFSFFYTVPDTYLYLDTNIGNSFVKNPSPDQQDAMKHQEAKDKFWKEDQHIVARYNELYSRLERGDKTQQLTDSLKISENDLNQVYRQRLEFEFDYIKNNPRSLSAIEQLSGIIRNPEGRSRVEDFKAVYNALPEDVKESDQGEYFSKAIAFVERGNRTNVDFDDFIAVDENEKVVSTVNYRGNYILIDFWASWCVPCREEHPKLISLYRKYGSRLKIISISTDTDLDQWRKAITHDKVGLWTHLSTEMNPKNNFKGRYSVSGIPHKILISPEGKLIKRWFGANDGYFDELTTMIDSGEKTKN